MCENKNTADLVDIGTVKVDKNLPQSERYAEYKKQIKDPCHYISEQFTIKAIHPNNGKFVEDCLRGMTD